MNYSSQGSVKTGPAVVFFVIFISLSVFVYLLSTNRISIAYNTNYQPDQPIPFSHAIHAGEYHIDCRYCHTSVTRGKHAGVPSLDVCMNCHLTIKPDSPWIQKITSAYQNNEPIVWEKVHLLPDFVRFNHSLHIKALVSKNRKDGQGKSLLLSPAKEQIRNTCTLCHGKVENMSIMYQKESLSMGWCVQCHRKEEHKAPLNCTTCHY